MRVIKRMHEMFYCCLGYFKWFEKGVDQICFCERWRENEKLALRF